MTKIKKVEIENIDNKSGTHTPDYSYGRNQEPLDAKVALRNISGVNTYVGTDTINMNVGDIKKYTTGFKPSKIEINAINTYGGSGSISSSIGYSTGDKGHINFIQYSDGDSVPLTASYDDTLIIGVYRKDSGGTRHHNEYYIDSIDGDGFNLKCQTNDQGDYIHIIISCI